LFLECKDEIRELKKYTTLWDKVWGGEKGHIIDNTKGLLAKLEDELSLETYTAALERDQELELDGVIADLVLPRLC